jgi:hypothetical protein
MPDMIAYLNSININKTDLMVDDIAEKAYPAFMINKGLSYYSDTIFHSNEMNRYHQSLSNKMQYEYFRLAILKRKRYSKWFKPEVTEDIAAVAKYYDYSINAARDIMHLLSPEQLNYIREETYNGGRKKQPKRKAV